VPRKNPGERLDRLERVVEVIAEDQLSQKNQISLQKTIAQLATETRRGFERVTAQFRETDRRMRKTDEHIRRTDQRLKEYMRKSDERLKKTEAHLDQRIANLVSAIGELIRRSNGARRH